MKLKEEKSERREKGCVVSMLHASSVASLGGEEGVLAGSLGASDREGEPFGKGLGASGGGEDAAAAPLLEKRDRDDIGAIVMGLAGLTGAALGSEVALDGFDLSGAGRGRFPDPLRTGGEDKAGASADRGGIGEVAMSREGERPPRVVFDLLRPTIGGFSGMGGGGPPVCCSPDVALIEDGEGRGGRIAVADADKSTDPSTSREEDEDEDEEEDEEDED